MPHHRVGPAGTFCRDDDFADPWQAHGTVLLQHGFARNGNMFYGWVPHLSREFRVLRPDLCGMGQSCDPGPDYRFTLDDLCADFLVLLDTLRIERVHYVGESFGGLLGIALAARFPQRIQTLTLVSTIVQVQKEAGAVASSVGYDSRIEAFRSMGLKRWWLKFREGTGELTGNPAKDEWFAEEFARTPVHVACALWQFAPTVSVAPLLAQVQAPTLVLSPGLSLRTDRREQDLMVRSIPGARQVWYPDGRHIDCYLRPDRLAQDTLPFLRAAG